MSCVSVRPGELQRANQILKCRRARLDGARLHPPAQGRSHQDHARPVKLPQDTRSSRPWPTTSRPPATYWQRRAACTRTTAGGSRPAPGTDGGPVPTVLPRGLGPTRGKRVRPGVFDDAIGPAACADRSAHDAAGVGIRMPLGWHAARKLSMGGRHATEFRRVPPSAGARRFQPRTGAREAAGRNAQRVNASTSSPADDMVWVPGGTFRMGSDDHYPEETPARNVEVGGLWVCRTMVTNAAFAAFVAATGYRTVAGSGRLPRRPGREPGARFHGVRSYARGPSTCVT